MQTIVEAKTGDRPACNITLRSEVSILVPNGVGSAEPEVAEAARWLLSDGDLRLLKRFISN